MAELKGIAYLQRKLQRKRPRILERYRYYDMKSRALDFGISTPPDLRYWFSCLGWCKTAVDSISDRMIFREFKNDYFGLNEIFQMNNSDIFFDSVCKGALISSCDFVYISPDGSGFPRLQAIDGGNATGEIDPITNLLTEGYAVLERDSDTNEPTLEAYFIPGLTLYYMGGNLIREYRHNVPYPLLVPVIYSPDASRPFGHSRISRACMSLMDSAIRTVKRSEISAEFYSYPQKWVSGLATDAEKLNSWKASMSSMLIFSRDSENDKPQLGQFQQQTMAPHMEQLKMFASLFAGETGLTLDDLGFVASNPSSAESIKASHETLRLTARKAQSYFGAAFLNIGMVAACLRDNHAYRRNAFSETQACWYPVFEPDYAALSQVGDGAIKINQAIPNFFDARSLSDMTGINPADGADNGYNPGIVTGNS